MDRTALLVNDAQQEYFAPIGKLVLPDGPRAVERVQATLASLNGFLATVTTSDAIIEESRA